MAAFGFDPVHPFFTSLAQNPSRVLLLDYDATLARLQEDAPHDGRPDGLPRLLQSIRDTGTRLVVLTGRSATSLVPLLGMSPPPEIFGAHGAERLLPDGSRRLCQLARTAVQALAEASIRLANAGLGAMTEHSMAAVAVHWRGLDTAQRVRVANRARQALADLRNEEVGLVPFDGGMELRVLRPNKSDAATTVLCETPGACAAYLGDDLLDPGAFEVVRDRGIGIRVSASRRNGHAGITLRPPELPSFLRQWLRSCVGGT